MSSIAFTTLDLPDALAPNTPAMGSTPIGLPPSRQVTERTTSSSASRVERSDNSISSRNDRTFFARNARNTEEPRTGLDEFMRRLLQETFADASLINRTSHAGHHLIPGARHRD